MAKRSTNSFEQSSPNPKQPELRTESLCFNVLKPEFYLRRSSVVGRELLGKYLMRFIDDKTPLVARIVETEAYEGSEDPASHALRGVTARNQPMFEAGGILYVYLSYGVHHCMNVVTGPKGSGEAVLIRAAEPVMGADRMRRRRRLAKGASESQLLSGPGKLCQALGVGLTMNFHDLSKPPLMVVAMDDDGDDEIVATPRIGISKAKDAPLRFCIKRSGHLSRRLAPSAS